MAENHMMGYSKSCRGNKLYPNTPCNAQKCTNTRGREIKKRNAQKKYGLRERKINKRMKWK